MAVPINQSGGQVQATTGTEGRMDPNAGVAQAAGTLLGVFGNIVDGNQRAAKAALEQQGAEFLAAGAAEFADDAEAILTQDPVRQARQYVEARYAAEGLSPDEQTLLSEAAKLQPDFQRAMAAGQGAVAAEMIRNRRIVALVQRAPHLRDDIVSLAKSIAPSQAALDSAQQDQKEQRDREVAFRNAQQQSVLDVAKAAGVAIQGKSFDEVASKVLTDVYPTLERTDTLLRQTAALNADTGLSQARRAAKTEELLAGRLPDFIVTATTNLQMAMAEGRPIAERRQLINNLQTRIAQWKLELGTSVGLEAVQTILSPVESLVGMAFSAEEGNLADVQRMNSTIQAYASNDMLALANGDLARFGALLDTLGPWAQSPEVARSLVNTRVDRLLTGAAQFVVNGDDTPVDPFDYQQGQDPAEVRASVKTVLSGITGNYSPTAEQVQTGSYSARNSLAAALAKPTNAEMAIVLGELSKPSAKPYLQTPEFQQTLMQNEQRIGQFTGDLNNAIMDRLARQWSGGPGSPRLEFRAAADGSITLVNQGRIKTPPELVQLNQLLRVINNTTGMDAAEHGRGLAESMNLVFQNRTADRRENPAVITVPMTSYGPRS